jgi:hypothetical protein
VFNLEQFNKRKRKYCVFLKNRKYNQQRLDTVYNWVVDQFQLNFDPDPDQAFFLIPIRFCNRIRIRIVSGSDLKILFVQDLYQNSNESGSTTQLKIVSGLC